MNAEEWYEEAKRRHGGVVAYPAMMTFACEQLAAKDGLFRVFAFEILVMLFGTQIGAEIFEKYVKTESAAAEAQCDSKTPQPDAAQIRPQTRFHDRGDGMGGDELESAQEAAEAEARETESLAHKIEQAREDISEHSKLLGHHDTLFRRVDERFGRHAKKLTSLDGDVKRVDAKITRVAQSAADLGLMQSARLDSHVKRFDECEHRLHDHDRQIEHARKSRGKMHGQIDALEKGVRNVRVQCVHDLGAHARRITALEETANRHEGGYINAQVWAKKTDDRISRLVGATFGEGGLREGEPTFRARLEKIEDRLFGPFAR
jgi:hypothetical protein